MSNSTPAPRLRRPSMRVTRLAALILAFGFAAPAVHAEEPGAQPVADVAPSAPTTPGDAQVVEPIELSPFELAQLLRSRLAAYTIAPRATTRESAVRSAWRASLKPRARRMLARMQRVTEARRWDARSPSIDDWAPTTASTDAMLRELSALYVELAAAQERVAKARIVEQETLYFGTVPGRKGREPTQEIEMAGVQAATGIHGGIHVGPGGIHGHLGGFYKSKTRRVKIKIFDREVEQRMKEQAQARIDAQVAAIRANIDAYTHALARDRDLVRALAESIQLGAELRLAQAITALGDGDSRREASQLLAEMRIARVDARALLFENATRYSQAIRRGWMQKRAQLDRLLAA